MLAVVAKLWRSVCSVTPLSLARLSDALPCRGRPNRAFRPDRSRKRTRLRHAAEACQQIGRRLAQRPDAVALLSFGKPELPRLKIHLGPSERQHLAAPAARQRQQPHRMNRERVFALALRSRSAAPSAR